MKLKGVLTTCLLVGAFLSLGFLIENEVSAEVRCKPRSYPNSICNGNAVAESCTNGVTTSKCLPLTFQTVPVDGLVECYCPTNELSSDQQRWLADYVSDYNVSEVAESSKPAICIPESCSGEGEYEPDFSCILAKNFSTNKEAVNCCENKCKNAVSNCEVNPNSSGCGILAEFSEFDIFNTKVKITYDKIPTIINLVFSTVLGVLAVYAAIRGIYIYAIKMPNASKDDELAAISKEAKAILIGFVLALSFLFLVQVVFSILGLPAINEINISTTPGESSGDVPEIIIQ